MKIAIPSDDGVTIARHFGRAKGFVLVEFSENKVTERKYRENDFTGHAHGESHHHDHSHGNHNHSHEGIFNSIGDCDVVIAGGMGRRLVNDFEARKIETFLTREDDIETALDLFGKGQLDNSVRSCAH